MADGTEVALRATIEEIVRYRDQALQAYCIAFGKIEEASAAFNEAHEIASKAHSGELGHVYDDGDEVKEFHAAVRLPEREKWLRVARKLVDCRTWAWLINHTQLERLMDVQAKEELHRQMKYVPERRNGYHDRNQLATGEEERPGLPEITVENVRATMETFLGSAEHIWRRGLANAFSQLDRRFKSHDGFKIGSRIILSHAFNEWGSWAYGWKHHERLMDVERVFLALDGRDVTAAYGGIVGAVDNDRNHTHGPRQGTVESEYFKCEIYLNGNLHIWFKRRDLLQQVNKILAEWYGEVIGDAHAEEDIFANRKTMPAKYFGFYPTPDDAAAELLRNLPFYRSEDAPPLRILEPSAGTGNLARRCFNACSDEDHCRSGRPVRTWTPLVDCVEIQAEHAMQLDASGIYNRVYHEDFLKLDPAVTGTYDMIVMNPPFDLERDIDHVTHAMAFLAPQGCLAAIMSAGTRFRTTRKATAFRALMKAKGARWDDLPACSFSEVGTNVNTLTVKFWNHGRQFSW